MLNVNTFLNCNYMLPCFFVFYVSLISLSRPVHFVVDLTVSYSYFFAVSLVSVIVQPQIFPYRLKTILLPLSSIFAVQFLVLHVTVHLTTFPLTATSTSCY